MAHLRSGFPTVTGEFLESLRAATARWHKQNVGRGPQRVEVELNGDVLTITLEGFLSPLEKVLLQDRANVGMVLGVRNCLLSIAIPGLNEIFSQQGLRATEYDGNLDWERERGLIQVKLEKL